MTLGRTGLLTTVTETGVEPLLGLHPALLAFLPVALACGLDRLVGDPRWCLHPVVVMGWAIQHLRSQVEALAGDRPWALRLGGGLLAGVLVGASGAAGWGIERLALAGTGAPDGWAWAGFGLLTSGLASALAGRSLEQAVRAVLQALPVQGEALQAGAPTPAGRSDPDLSHARQQLAWIVGRDTDRLDRSGILRALAETASENAVDGLFAPLFWMLAGAGLWALGWLGSPGPLALAWSFKAASTLDSMLGYRCGRLRWLGTAGARLDDLLVWLPCRLVSLSLPLVQTWPPPPPRSWWRQVRHSWRDGRPDPSPNAGLSQAAFAHASGVQLGGLNHYGGIPRPKPLLAPGQRAPDRATVERMLAMSQRLELLWLATSGGLVGTLASGLEIITKTLS